MEPFSRFFRLVRINLVRHCIIIINLKQIILFLKINNQCNLRFRPVPIVRSSRNTAVAFFAVFLLIGSAISHGLWVNAVVCIGETCPAGIEPVLMAHAFLGSGKP